MVEMDSRLKGIILNSTLKSYKITPIERANVLEIRMRFYGGFKYKSPSKGIILNSTLKSYKITPIERANVLEIRMRFYGGFKYKSPSKRRQDKLRKEKFLAKFKRDPLLVPIPFLEPGQSPSPVILGQSVCWAIATAFTIRQRI